MNDIYYSIGSDFIDGSGIRDTVTQACISGKAYGICWWENGSLVKRIMTEKVCEKTFILESKKLLENSIPVQFRNPIQ